MTIFDFKLPRRHGRDRHAGKPAGRVVKSLGAGVGLTSAWRSLSPFLRGEDGERSEPGEGHG